MEGMKMKMNKDKIIEDMINLYKEIQENYIKALERENDELRKQREKDSLRIEELEKEVLSERRNKIRNIPNPPVIDDNPFIGPNNPSWGWSSGSSFPSIGKPNYYTSDNTSDNTTETLVGAAGSISEYQRSQFKEQIKKAYDSYQQQKMNNPV